MSKVRRQHYLNACKVKTSADSSLRCHSNLKQRADRQKIQMNALFLPGVFEKGADEEVRLSGSCWLSATWDCFGSSKVTGCVCADRIELLMAKFAPQPQMGFVSLSLWCPKPNYSFKKTPPPVTLCLNFNQLFRSLSIWVLPGVQRRSLKINFQSVKDKVTTGQRTSRLFLW